MINPAHLDEEYISIPSGDQSLITGFEHSEPRLLFNKPGYNFSMPTRCWDISPDGRRFLMIKLVLRKDASATEMIIVKNWFEELKRIVPKPKD